MTPTRDRREERFERLFRAHHDAVRAYVWRREPAAADDVVAETFLVAWRRLDEVPPAALLWLIGVARNVRLNERRGDRRRAALEQRLAAAPAPAAEPAPAVPGPIGDALARLSDRDREMLLLVAWEGLDHAGVAAALGVSRANVAVRLFRARARMRALLADDHADLLQEVPDGC